MAEIGTASTPLRVAIIGAGPAGFYAAEHLLRQSDLTVSVDLFDRLPTPHGLVRLGVAPDHQKIKNVTRVYDKTAAREGFRFLGNVEYGRDVTLDDLRAHYHQIIFTTGAQVDRALGIPGEDLLGSHSATEFVAWYNGHPDYRDCVFDLSQESVGIVGVGNVAVDVARILCRTIEELEATDIAEYALDALRESRVREVYMLGRRGPAQAAFTVPEAKELGEMPGAEVHVPPAEAALDPLSAADLADADRGTRKKVELIQKFAELPESDKPRRLTIRFLVSPVELLDDGAGRVGGMRIVRNELYRTEDGRTRPRHTEDTEVLPVGLVFRSVGYRGVALPEVPFHERWGVILNKDGRVLDPGTDAPIAGLYTAGWIKRGPSGVIGTNKACAVETVNLLLADLAEGRHLTPAHPDASAFDTLLATRAVEPVTYGDWLRLDAIESERGAALGRPRVKFSRVADMLAALGREDPAPRLNP